MNAFSSSQLSELKDLHQGFANIWKNHSIFSEKGDIEFEALKWVELVERLNSISRASDNDFDIQVSEKVKNNIGISSIQTVSWEKEKKKLS